MAATATFDSLALGNRFQVVLDDGKINLGYWSKVSGLDVTWDLCEYRSGESGNSRLFYPGKTKYSDIQLSRAACVESQTVRDWLSQCSVSNSLQGYSGTIYLGNSEAQAVMQWDIINCRPQKWSITGFDANQSGVSIETLVLWHEGFLQDDATFNNTLLTSTDAMSTAAGFGVQNQEAGNYEGAAPAGG
ncbi:phage tail protein [Streptomyces sp. NPDC048419]|uniref:phage tail protein n=1 Tax=Streptomyces sp. NPDC048419 TaxID=3365547 RepID=UPI00371C1B1F